MLELCCNEPAGSFCRVVAADAGMGISLQLREYRRYGLSVSIHHPIISSHKGGEGDRFGGGKSRIPTCPMFDRLRYRTICVGLFGRNAMANHLLSGLRVLAVRKG